MYRVEFRREFSYLLSSNIANMVSLHPGECYAVAGLSRTDSLALLLTGKCSVLNSQTFLHNIEAGEFLDSPEFDSSSEARSFQVTVCAGVTSKYISWQRSKLEYLLGKEGFIVTDTPNREQMCVLENESLDFTMQKDSLHALVRLQLSISVTLTF